MARAARSNAPTKTAAERSEEHAQRVADLIVEQLRNGVAPWQRPWEQSRAGLPTNAISDRPYNGSNAIYLMAKAFEGGYQDGRWMTFKQALELGGNVKAGEKGTTICYPVRGYMREARDENGKPKLGPNGQPEKEYIKYSYPQMKYYTVFSVEQCEGLEKLPQRPEGPKHEWTQHERAQAVADAFFKGTGVRLQHGGNRAYYMPMMDSIQMPTREQFASADRYFATLFHEAGHATGHPDRLNRDLSGSFGSESYAREELKAEIASLMLGQTLELGHDPGPHAAYVDHWIKQIQENPKELIVACNDASKIHEYVLQYDRTRTQELEADLLTDKQAHDVAKEWKEFVLVESFNDFIDTGTISDGLLRTMRSVVHENSLALVTPEGREKAAQELGALKNYMEAAGERGPVREWELHEAQTVTLAMPGAFALGSDGRTSLTDAEIADANPTFVKHEPGRAEGFTGEYLGYSEQHVFQAGQQGELLAHDRELFRDATLPNVGERMHVSYHPTQDRVDVRELPARELELARDGGRGLTD